MAKRVLVLFSETFADGGIQRFNRTFLAACERLEVACDVYSFADSEDSARRWTASPNVTIRAFGRDKLRFVKELARAMWSGRYHSVVIGHVHMVQVVVAMAALKAFRGPRLMLIAHGVEIWTGVRRLRRRALAAVDRILCVSDFTKTMIQAQAPEVGESRFAIFPNALSETWIGRQAMHEAAHRGADFSLDVPARFILSVARLSRHDRGKGVIAVIEALSMLADCDVHYVIAGRGDDMDFLRQTARRFNVAERVHFLGAVTDQHLVALYRRCCAFVLPSGQEGFGIVFLEAMYFGAPVIAAREKGAVDVVQDEETGLLVGFGDVVALKRAIERVLDDPELREHIRGRARMTVTGQGAFTFSAFTARCATLLEVPIPDDGD
jgi:glycosyltransferase involved in cell wall biosynthesis